MQRFKNSYFITKFCQISCTSNTRRARTNYSNFSSIGFLRLFRGNAMLPCPIGCKTLQFSNRNRLSFYPSYTFPFALAFLWAYTATYGWKCRRFWNNFICFLYIPILDFFNKTRNINGHWAASHTSCIFTF